MNDLINKAIEFLRNEEKFIKQNLKEIKALGFDSDIRLCLELSDSGKSIDSWALLYGDSSYDQRHSPICAASSIGKKSNINDLFESLIDDCLDQCAEVRI